MKIYFLIFLLDYKAIFYFNTKFVEYKIFFYNFIINLFFNINNKTFCQVLVNN